MNVENWYHSGSHLCPLKRRFITEHQKGKPMPLRGRAFVSLWSGLLKGYEPELDRWHTIEHMPERLGVPGFLRGRRYMASKASDHAMFIFYEAAHIDTFRSPGLLARLNDPTEWSKRVQPGLVNFIRAPCRTLVSLGEGVGGALMAIRVFGGIGDKTEVGHSLVNAAPTILRMHGVTAIHIGQHAPDSIETAETKLRPTTSPVNIHFVVLIEGIGVSELENVANSVTDKVTGASAGSCEASVYRLAYLLDSVG